RPCDGSTLCIKSGQVSVRRQPLTLPSLPVEVLFPASLGSPPALNLIDPVEDVSQTLSPTVRPFPGSNLFRIAGYGAPMYPDAVYNVSILGGTGDAPSFVRPFPADPDDLTAVSRFILGADGWVSAFPAPTTVTLAIQPKPASSFVSGLTVQAGVGNAPAHETVAAVR